MRYSNLIFATGMEWDVDRFSFKFRIEVDNGREGSEISSGGLRVDFRRTVRVSVGEALVLVEEVFWRLLKGRESLGRMYCGFC